MTVFMTVRLPQMLTKFLISFLSFSWIKIYFDIFQVAIPVQNEYRQQTPSDDKRPYGQCPGKQKIYM
jgi:hypothetical protein